MIADVRPVAGRPQPYSHMTPDKRSDNQSLLGKPIGVLLGSPWLEVLGQVWKVLWKAMQGRFHKGLYKVLEYESTLELKDRGGKRGDPLEVAR